jgi:hypothetical protein
VPPNHHGLRLEWDEFPFRTPGKKDKPLRYARFGNWQRRKSPVRRCFKSRPPFGGVRRFASGCRSFQAVNRPLVRIPANRHTTTGTCEIGHAQDMKFRAHYKHFFAKYVAPIAIMARQRQTAGPAAHP